MRRLGWPFASTLLVLSACNALTGVVDLSTCPRCDEGPDLDASFTGDTRVPETGASDAIAADARDSATQLDAGRDSDADADTGAPLGCQGAADCVRVMFPTSVAFNGNLGGIPGADAKCQALADGSNNARIKGRTFLAWVSTAAIPVTTRVTHGNQAYIRADGAAIAANFIDLTNGDIQNGISVDEKGGSRNGVGAWTGTNSGGATYSGSSCLDWMVAIAGAKGDIGNVGGNGSGWSSLTTDDCSAPHSLYCVEK